MASWDDIKDLRLKISDPDGVIDLATVADESHRPMAPIAQTAYRIESKAEYQVYDAEAVRWERLDLLLPDSRLSALIDAAGSALKAAPGAIRLIIAGLGQRLGTIKRQTAGGETTEFVTLKEAYDFYALLLGQFEREAAEASGTSSGLYVRTRRPQVGGGMEGCG